MMVDGGRYNVTFSLDKDLVIWLDQRKKDGDNKSDIARRALNFYRKFGDLLEIEKLAASLERLPEIYGIVDSISQKLDNVNLNSTLQRKTEEPIKSNVLDLMAQMDDI